MPGWGREVQRWYITYGWDDSWPADFEGRVEVTDVAIESQRPADGVTGDVIFLEKEYANDDETSDDFWWYYEGLNYGGATLRVTYTDPFGVAQSYTFDVIVDSDVYELDAWVEDGSFNALPGATKQLGAWGIHKRQDQPDTQEGLTYQWSIVDGQEFATIEGQGEDATLSLKPYEGDDPFWQEHVQVQVTLFDGGTEVARYDDLHVTVAALYGEIWPRVLDRLNVGESVTITPELRSYAIEHLDTGGYITLPTKDGKIRLAFLQQNKDFILHTLYPNKYQSPTDLLFSVGRNAKVNTRLKAEALLGGQKMRYRTLTRVQVEQLDEDMQGQELFAVFDKKTDGAITTGQYNIAFKEDDTEKIEQALRKPKKRR